MLTVSCGRDSKQLRVMKQRLKQLEFQEKLKQKLDVAGHCDVNQNSPAVCSTTPTGTHGSDASCHSIQQLNQYVRVNWRIVLCAFCVTTAAEIPRS